MPSARRSWHGSMHSFDDARFQADFQAMLLLNGAPFEAAMTLPGVEVRSNATVHVDGAVYSVPSRWARRQATAYVGVSAIRVVCGDEEITRPRQRRGGRLIRYIDYLPELSRKPQALRQVAHALLPELGEPYTTLWRLLVDAHGPPDAARVLAKVLAAVSTNGDQAVSTALKPLMDFDAPANKPSETVPNSVPVPSSLAHQQVESACAQDYDVLLQEAAHG